MKFYLAGPMTGIPKFNYPAFIEAAKNLREQGCEIISPAELDDDEVVKAAMDSIHGIMEDDHCAGQTWGDFLARDVKIVADMADGVIMLPGWESSKGARLEVFVAINGDKPLYEYLYGGLIPISKEDAMGDIVFNTVGEIA